MKVHELIEQLKKQDPEKEVMIQQGEEHDYMVAHTVKEMQLIDAEEFGFNEDDDEHVFLNAVVIQYS